MEDLFRSLPALMKEFDASPEVREAVVFAAWRKAAGEALAGHAVPSELSEKRLTVSVKDKVWKRHLEDLGGQLIFRLNSILGSASITFIEFFIDQEAVDRAGPKRDRERASETELRELARNEISDGLMKSASSIRDEKLRDAFLLAAGSCLLRKKTNAR